MTSPATFTARPVLTLRRETDGAGRQVLRGAIGQRRFELRKSGDAYELLELVPAPVALDDPREVRALKRDVKRARRARRDSAEARATRVLQDLGISPDEPVRQDKLDDVIP